MANEWTFNGVDGASGSYLLQASPAVIAKVASGAPLDPAMVGELKYRHQLAKQSHFGVKAGVDVNDLAETGWGVVFPLPKPKSPEAMHEAALREALSQLLAHRRAVAGQYYREYGGVDGVRPGEGKPQWLARHGGRQDLLAAETRALALPRRLALFAVANADDEATKSSAESLAAPLRCSTSRSARRRAGPRRRSSRRSAGPVTPGAALREHHATLLRAALDRQTRTLALLRRLTDETGRGR